MKAYFRKLMSLYGDVELISSMAHFPMNVKEAVVYVNRTREISKKISEGYFSERLVVVPTLGKSASGVLGKSVAIMHQAYTGQFTVDQLPRYVSGLDDHNIRVDMLLHHTVRDGGVVSLHARPSGENLALLNLLGSKYVVNFRHPADNMVAIACGKYGANPNYSKDGNWAFTYQGPVKSSLYGSEVDVKKKIGYLIHTGFLASTLSWIVGWLQFRDQHKSIVNRYEDFVTDRRHALDRIGKFLYGHELNDSVLEQCDNLADNWGKRKLVQSQEALNSKSGDKFAHISSKGKNNKYPYGWTGKIGVWRDYYSKENKAAFTSVIDGFLRSHPNSDILLDFYPDLLDIN
jgi:hypothetical protein